VSRLLFILHKVCPSHVPLTHILVITLAVLCHDSFCLETIIDSYLIPVPVCQCHCAVIPTAFLTFPQAVCLSVCSQLRFKISVSILRLFVAVIARLPAAARVQRCSDDGRLCLWRWYKLQLLGVSCVQGLKLCVYMVRVFMDRELWLGVANNASPSPGCPYHGVLRGQVRHDLTGLWPKYTKMTFRIIRASYTTVGAVERDVLLWPARLTALSDASTPCLC
jgi:hypothetical protein